MPCPRSCPNDPLDLPAWYDTLAPGTSAKARFAPPPEHEDQLLIPVLIVVFGIVALFAGTVLGGLLAILVGVGWVGVDRWRSGRAARSLTAWKRSMYCEGCGDAFDPVTA